MLRQILLRNFMVRRLALGSPYSKPSTATAEDGLPNPASRPRFAGLLAVSIVAALMLTQRGYPIQDRRMHSVPASARAAPVPAPQWIAGRKCDGNNVHTEPAETRKAEAQVFQKGYEGVTDRLVESHIPGNKTL